MTNAMKKLIRHVAFLLGVRTVYHVSAVYRRDSYVTDSLVTLIVPMYPWLHEDNYAELIARVEIWTTRPSGPPAITSITKLGL